MVLTCHSQGSRTLQQPCFGSYFILNWTIIYKLNVIVCDMQPVIETVKSFGLSTEVISQVRGRISFTWTFITLPFYNCGSALASLSRTRRVLPRQQEQAASKACYLFRAGACTGGNINNSRSLSVLIMYTMLNVLSEHNQDV